MALGSLLIGFEIGVCHVLLSRYLTNLVIALELCPLSLYRRFPRGSARDFGIVRRGVDLPIASLLLCRVIDRSLLMTPIDGRLAILRI